MAWRDAAEEGMPPPRRSEPESLRGDILDELADHLALAAEREGRKSNEGEDGNWSRVLDNFGDPAAVARRLWWDAMREKIMREWIQTGSVVVGMVVLVVFTTLNLNQMRASNEAILTALQAQGEVVDPTIAYLDVEVRRGDSDGPPAEGVRVTLTGRPFPDSESSITESVDEEGRLGFGPIQPGVYSLSLRDNLFSAMSGLKELTLYGGREELQWVLPDYRMVPISTRTVFPPGGNDERVLFLGTLSWFFDAEGEFSGWHGMDSETLLVGSTGIWRAETTVPPETEKAEIENPWRARLYENHIDLQSGAVPMVPEGASLALRIKGIAVIEPGGSAGASAPDVATRRFAVLKPDREYHRTTLTVRPAGSSSTEVHQDSSGNWVLDLPGSMSRAYLRENRIQEIHAARPEWSPEEVYAMVDGAEIGVD